MRTNNMTKSPNPITEISSTDIATHTLYLQTAAVCITVSLTTFPLPRNSINLHSTINPKGNPKPINSITILHKTISLSCLKTSFHPNLTKYQPLSSMKVSSISIKNQKISRLFRTLSGSLTLMSCQALKTIRKKTTIVNAKALLTTKAFTTYLT